MTLVPEEISKPPFRSEDASEDTRFNAVRIAVWHQLLSAFEDGDASMVDGLTILGNLAGTLSYHLEKQGMPVEETGHLLNLNVHAGYAGMKDIEIQMQQDAEKAGRKNRRFYERVLGKFRR